MTDALTEDLVRRIAEQETGLAALRRELEGRLQELNRRREALRSELGRVEAEIETVRRSNVLAPDGGRTALSALLPRLVAEANGRPVTARELAERVRQLGFATASKNFGKVVENRAYELVKKGVLVKAKGGAGFLLSRPVNGHARNGNGHAGARTSQPPLRQVLAELLRKSGRTMAVGELAQQALAAGYRTRSGNFKNVIWVELGKMLEVERDPKGGYRLKKGQ